MKKNAADILDEAAATFRKRNKEYGQNWEMVGPALAALFPSGITLSTPDDFTRFHFLMLKIVKLTRYTTNWKKGGHVDSIHDDAVYATMLQAFDAMLPRPDAKPPRVPRVRRPQSRVVRRSR